MGKYIFINVATAIISILFSYFLYKIMPGEPLSAQSIFVLVFFPLSAGFIAGLWIKEANFKKAFGRSVIGLLIYDAVYCLPEVISAIASAAFFFNPIFMLLSIPFIFILLALSTFLQFITGTAIACLYIKKRINQQTYDPGNKKSS